MILSTTAGKVGGEAARLLAEQGTPVRVIARHPEALGRLTEAGVEVRRGDLDDPATIDAAMTDVDSIVLVSPPSVAHETNVIDSARRHGAGHIVKITSKASLDSPIARRRDQATIEQHLAESGIAHTLLRNNAYMQNLLMMAPVIAQTDSFSTATGDGRIGQVDARDVAAVAATIAASPTSYAGRTLWPTGPESLSNHEVAEVLTRQLGRPITFHPIGYEQQKEAMMAVGLPERVAQDNARAVAMMAEGDCDYVTDDVATVLGRPAGSLAQFVADNARAFS